MRCRVGDLAIIVREDRGYECNIGSIVKVIRLYRETEWVIVSDHKRLLARQWPFRLLDRKKLANVGDELILRDDYMRPLRDPGDEARDETLLWLPVPSDEKVLA
jgi:hypothetical protein